MEFQPLAMKRLAFATLLLAAPVVVHAQTQQKLDSAVALYKQFNVEAARPILLSIISPGYLYQVSSKQKATAFKYLGASYAVLASPDSAKSFFIAALDFDPFTDLDPNEFAETELAAFAEAKKAIFKVAIQPLEGSFLIRPRESSDSGAFVFRLITTQRASLHVELFKQSDTTVKEILYDGPNDGARGISWRGVRANGDLIPPGPYVLLARSTPSSAAPGTPPNTETMNFRIEHIFQPLEDTLPALDPATNLLPPRINGSAPWLDLAKGFSVAVVAGALPFVALDAANIKWELHALSTAAAGLIAGAGSLYYRRKHPEIPQNVQENTRRITAREQFNAAVRQRNQGRLDRTLLVISPVTSFGQ